MVRSPFYCFYIMYSLIVKLLYWKSKIHLCCQSLAGICLMEIMSAILYNNCCYCYLCIIMNNSCQHLSISGNMLSFKISSAKASSTNVKDFPTLEEWLKTQDDRHKTLAAYCGTPKPINKAVARIWKPGTTEWSPSFLFHDKYKVVNCNIPKVASTSIKIMMANVTGKLPHYHVEDEYLLHQWSYLGKSLMAINDLRPSQIKYILDKKRSFLFVRHPIHRIISAYRGKIEKLGRQRLINVVRAITQFKGESNVGNEDNNHQTVTFSDFIDWLVATRSTDSHWRSFENTCFPCHINYTYIGHVETLSEDAFYIMNELYGNKAALSTLKYLPHLNSNNGDGSRVTQKYLQQLSSQQMLELNHFVMNDSKAFGYPALL